MVYCIIYLLCDTPTKKTHAVSLYQAECQVLGFRYNFSNLNASMIEWLKMKRHDHDQEASERMCSYIKNDFFPSVETPPALCNHCKLLLQKLLSTQKLDNNSVFYKVKCHIILNSFIYYIFELSSSKKMCILYVFILFTLPLFVFQFDCVNFTCIANFY